MPDLFVQLRWQDLFDVILVAFGAYWIIHFIRGTRAVQMLVGLVVLFLAYFGSQLFEMYTLNWVLNNFISSILLITVVLFQHDIRRALTEMGRGSLFGIRRRAAYTPLVEELTRAAISLASKRIGALVVLERTVGLNEYIQVGTPLDAQLSRELLGSIFLPGSPIHDGAVVIQAGRIAAAGCYLPLTANPNVSKQFGTRHRAAIGLTEETDAIVVLVSEEEGTVSLVREGQINQALDAGALRNELQQFFLHD